MRSIVLLATACLFGVAAASRAAEPDVWLISATKIYPAPGVAPILRGAVLTSNGSIAAVDDTNTRRRIRKGTKTDPVCQGVVVAGFQNSHVHFIEPRFRGAATVPAE